MSDLHTLLNLKFPRVLTDIIVEYYRPIKLWLWTEQDKNLVIYEYTPDNADNTKESPYSNENWIKRIPIPDSYTFICAHKTKLVWRCGDHIEIRDVISGESEIIPNPNAEYLNMLGNHLGAIIHLDRAIYWYTDTWMKLTLCPIPMINHKFSGNHAYAVNILPDEVGIARYDIVTGQWATLPILSLNTITHHFSLATVNNMTYAAVGLKLVTSPVNLYRFCDNWELVVVSNHDFQVNDIIGYGEYVFMDVFDTDYTNRVIVYNLVTKQWTYLTDYPNIFDDMSLV